MGHGEFPPRRMCALVWDRGEWSSRARSVVGKTRCIKIAFQHDLRASTYREIRIPDTMSGMCCSAHSRLPIGQRPLADKNWSMRVAHDAADYWSAPVTMPHIVVVLVPMIRTTAFACRNKNKLCVNLKTFHQLPELRQALSDIL